MHLKVILLSTLDGISNGLLNSLQSMLLSVVNFLKLLLDKIVIPIALVCILFRIFFLVISLLNAKRKREGQDLEECVVQIFIALAIFVVVGGYGIAFGGLFTLFS